MMNASSPAVTILPGIIEAGAGFTRTAGFTSSPQALTRTADILGPYVALGVDMLRDYLKAFGLLATAS